MKRYDVLIEDIYIYSVEVEAADEEAAREAALEALNGLEQKHKPIDGETKVAEVTEVAS